MKLTGKQQWFLVSAVMDDIDPEVVTFQDFRLCINPLTVLGLIRLDDGFYVATEAGKALAESEGLIREG
jgi:hypothetical protein